MKRVISVLSGNVKQLANEEDIKKLMFGLVLLDIITVLALNLIINAN